MRRAPALAGNAGTTGGKPCRHLLPTAGTASIMAGPTSPALLPVRTGGGRLGSLPAAPSFPQLPCARTWRYHRGSAAIDRPCSPRARTSRRAVELARSGRNGGSARTTTGTCHPGLDKSFFGDGESTRGEGAVFTKNASSPLVTHKRSRVFPAYFRPRSRSRLSTAMWPMLATAPAVEEEQWEPMTRLSSRYQRSSRGGSCSKTSRPAP